MQFSLFLRWLIIFSCIFSARAQETGPQEEHVVAGIDPVMEIRIGKLYRDQALKNYPVSKNQAYTDIVNRVGNRIANSIGERPDLIDDWEFTVVQADDVNARAFAGGKIVVFEGLLKLMTLNGRIDEDMLAAVLGHEMTHVVRRHVLLGLSNQGSLAWILEHLNAIESNTASGGLTQEELDKLGTLAQARFTRVQEFEADRFGALFAIRAGSGGFDGALRWMQLVDQKLGDYSTEAYLPFEGKRGEYLAADHPTWKERMAALLAYRENILNLAGEFNWGFYLLRSYNFEKAAECFNDVTKIFPESFEAWNNLGTAYHWMYLQQAGETEKFQPSLIDYFVPLRSQVRGENPLGKAIRCYQRALAINANAEGTKANLAIALISTREKMNLATAENLLRDLLAAEPSNRSYLNDYGILTYWLQDANSTKANHDAARNLFQKAVGAGSLCALYNLSLLQIDSGEAEKGMRGFAEYLKKDSFSPWAKRVFGIFEQRNVPIGSSKIPSSPPVTNILGIKLGATSDEVTKLIGKPDRIEATKTSAQDSGEIFWYMSSGIGVIFSEGKVILVIVSAATVGDQRFLQSGYVPQPEVAGIAIGTGLDDLQKIFGEPVSVRTDSQTGDKIYYYPSGDAILSFWVRSSVVYAITFTKAAPA